MKEMITSWIILLAIVILFMINSYIVKKVTTDICEDIEIAVSAIENENLSDAQKIIINMNTKWKKSSKKMIYIFPHSQLEEIGRILLMAKQHITEKDLNDTVLRLKEVDYLIRLLKQREKITLDNIF